MQLEVGTVPPSEIRRFSRNFLCPPFFPFEATSLQLEGHKLLQLFIIFLVNLTSISCFLKLLQLIIIFQWSMEFDQKLENVT